MASQTKSSSGQEGTRREVDRAVRAVLTRSPGYAALPPDTRRRLAADMVKVTEFVAAHHAPQLVNSVDFPTFVAGLVQGVFQAVVDASVEQMQAYAALVGDVARSLEEFAGGEPDAADEARRALAKERRQQLATMVLMGINRIVVTNGEVRAKVEFHIRAHEGAPEAKEGDDAPPRKPRRG
ncbi:MAG: hypothetical protein U0324_37125 [Polyangiales bacterium]